MELGRSPWLVLLRQELVFLLAAGKITGPEEILFCSFSAEHWSIHCETLNPVFRALEGEGIPPPSSIKTSFELTPEYPNLLNSSTHQKSTSSTTTCMQRLFSRDFVHEATALGEL